MKKERFIFLLEAFSATFLANISPKISPSPQLNKLTIMVKKEIIAAAFAVETQNLVILEIKEFTELLSVNV